MDFFDKIGKKASETYKTAAEKTNKIASDTKLKLKINETKSKIEDVYTEIGKKVFQKFVLDGNLDIKDDIKDELDKIKKLTDEMEEYECQRLDISDMKQCIQCKNKIEKTAKFCPICGAEQPETQDGEITAEVVSDEEQSENKEDVKNDVAVEAEEATNTEGQNNAEETTKTEEKNNVE